MPLTCAIESAYFECIKIISFFVLQSSYGKYCIFIFCNRDYIPANAAKVNYLKCNFKLFTQIPGYSFNFCSLPTKYFSKFSKNAFLKYFLDAHGNLFIQLIGGRNLCN